MEGPVQNGKGVAPATTMAILGQVVNSDIVADINIHHHKITLLITILYQINAK